MTNRPAHDSTAPLEKPIEPLRWIGAYKIFKGLLALIGGLLLLRLMHRDLPAMAVHWMEKVGVRPHSALGKLILHRLLSIHDRNIAWIAAGLFGYIPLACAEGIGLILRKVWAEWLTVVTTFALIPFEVREIVLRPTWLRVLILVLNILVLIYLVVRIRRDRHRHAPIPECATENPITPPSEPAADFGQSTGLQRSGRR
ncbi:MAG TPA: DUF2127 domain-containing protein [Tepidisphaeraceae bacterium]|jgi:uncharacterized membrane protein (DUF2068 family)